MDKNWRELEIFRKTTKIYELKVKKDGISEDITGWTIYFTVKKKMQDTDANAVISKTITTHTDATGGITLISLSTTDTDLRGNYYYDAKYKDSEGNIGILFNGRIKFKEIVTIRE